MNSRKKAKEGEVEEEHKPPTLTTMEQIKYDVGGFPKLLNENNEMRTGEIPSVNAQCSARGMAKLAACIVNGGTLDGVKIMSQETVKKMQEEPIVKRDAVLAGMKTEFTKGGFNIYRLVKVRAYTGFYHINWLRI